MKNKILLLLIWITFPLLTFSQEIVTGLYTNPAIKADMKTIRAKESKSIMLTIPFFDDFSGTEIFPDDSLWADRYAFINSSCPKHPVTIGVATFDAINDTGALYAEANSFSFTADSLTSNPIRLDSVFGTSPAALTIGDSVYFSFYYQPQGYGNAPETDDSLVLEFFSPSSGEWNHVWSDTGCTMQQFYSKNNVWFKQVMIPIIDSTNYFQKGFRFRFYNYASLANNNIPSWAGNVDQWNIDYVYLNRGRNKADSVYKDIAFVEPAPSVLKNYYSMPWSQFDVNPSAEMKDSLSMTITNLDTVTYNSSYKYDVEQAGGTWNSTYNGGSFNIDPYVTSGYQNYWAHAQPPVNFSFPSVSADSVSFLFTHMIKEGIVGDIRRQNDTISFEQKFYNYYAYDDGIPEAGYGLTPANSLLAYKFTLNHPDTLRAVNMFFNRTLNNSSQQFFYLTIWNDNGGYPGDTIYQMKGLKPKYADSLNSYIRYRIDNRKVLISGTFYVGWKQLTGDFLNIGLDRSSDQHSNIFYDVGSGWMNSSVAGALMIRPVFGKALPLVAGINETVASPNAIHVYPNPSNGENITIVLPSDAGQNFSKFTIHVYDMLGNDVYNSPFSETIHVKGLQNGIYILYVTSNISNYGYFTRLTIVK
jgi:hypothetical protein